MTAETQGLLPGEVHSSLLILVNTSENSKVVEA